MNLFKGLHSYFSSNNNGSVSGSLHRLMRSHLYIWNIPAGSTAFVNGKWQRSNTTLRNIQSVCHSLNTQWGDRYMLVNFSPFLLELYESCRTGQIVDFATHSVENFALLLELFFTINKWLALGYPYHEDNELVVAGNNNSNNEETNGDVERNAHCVVLVFLQEANAVIYPNYAAMIVSCYLTFAGWNGQEEWQYPERERSEYEEEYQEQKSSSVVLTYNKSNTAMMNANSFALADGDLTLTIVEHLIGIPRSRLHAASQESYVSCFQLLFIIPVLPNPHRLRLTRISIHEAPHLQHRTLGLQVESSGCEKFIKLFSDPTAWKCGDASSSEIYLDVNETLLGDFAIQLFDYDMVGNTNDNKTKEKTISTKSYLLKETSHLNREPICNINDNDCKESNVNEKSLVQGTINSLNAQKLTSDNINHISNTNNSKVIPTGSIVKADQLDVKSHKNSHTQEMRWGVYGHTHTPVWHSECVVTKSSSSSLQAVAAKQENKKYIKTRLLRLALSTIFICQTTHRVRVKDMDYALANSLGDSFYIALHFDEAMEEVHDIEYVTQLSERVELSPQRIRANKALASEHRTTNNKNNNHHHGPRDYSEGYNRGQSERSDKTYATQPRSKYRQSLRSMRGRGDHLDEELDLENIQNDENSANNSCIYEEDNDEDVNDENDEEAIVYYKSDGTRVTLKELERMYFSRKRRERSKYASIHNKHNTPAEPENTRETRMYSATRHQSKSIPLDHATMLYLPAELNMMEEDVREFDRDNEIAEQNKMERVNETYEHTNINNNNNNNRDMNESEAEYSNNKIESGDSPAPRPPVSSCAYIPLAPPPPPAMNVKGNIPLAPPPPPPMNANGIQQLTPNRLTQRSSQVLPSHAYNSKKILFSEEQQQEQMSATCESKFMPPPPPPLPSQLSTTRNTLAPVSAGPKMKTIFWKKLPRASGIWGVETISSLDKADYSSVNNTTNNSTEETSSLESIIDEFFMKAMFEVKPVCTDAQRTKTEQKKEESTQQRQGEEFNGTSQENDHSDTSASNRNRHDGVSKGTDSTKRHSVPMSNLFTPQRLQNMGITLKRLRMPLPKLITALITCDAKTFNEDQRSTLLAVLPSIDEFDALLSFYEEHDEHFGQNNEESEWYVQQKQLEEESEKGTHIGNAHLAEISSNNVEEYLVYLYKYVRDCRERLQLWNSMTEMTDSVPRITEQLNQINHAVQLVSDRHGSWAHALRSIRALGNYVNKGTIHADALGFKLESLGQLNLVKSTDGKTTTMLEAWILQMMEVNKSKHEDDVKSDSNKVKIIVDSTLPNALNSSTTHNTHVNPLSFVTELRPLEKLSSTTLSEVGQSITQMNTFMQRLRHLQNEAKNKSQWYTKRLPMFKYSSSSNDDECKKEKDSIVEDHLPIMIQDTLIAYMQLTTQLALQYQQVKNDTSAMLIGYGEDGTGDETIIWSYLTQFVQEVQKGMDKIKHNGITKQKLVAKLHPEMALTATAEVSAPEVVKGDNHLESTHITHKHVDPTSLQETQQ